MASVALHLQNVIDKKIPVKRVRWGSSHLADADTVVQSTKTAAGQQRGKQGHARAKTFHRKLYPEI
jgi:hypothetical protein